MVFARLTGFVFDHQFVNKTHFHQMIHRGMLPPPQLFETVNTNTNSWNIHRHENHHHIIIKDIQSNPHNDKREWK